MNRREFSGLLIGSLARGAIPPAAALLAAEHGHADAISGYAVAAMAIKAIADASRGDGGMGASFAALHDKANLLIHQVASLQRSVAFLIDQVGKLDQKLLDALGRQYGLELRDDVLRDIRLIRDLQEEARRKGIDLAQKSYRRTEFRDRLPSAYENFNRSHRKLWEAGAAAGSTPSLVCSACLGIDALAFSWGYIGADRLAINLEGHLAWLDRIVDPAQAQSAQTELDQELRKEAEFVATLVTEAAANNPASEIAAAVVSSPVGDVCVRFVMNVKYYSETPRNDWYNADPSSMIFVVKYTRDEVNEHGALLLRKIREAGSRDVALQIGGTTRYAYGKAKTIDQAVCKTFNSPEYIVPLETSYRMGLHREWANSPAAYKHLTPLISQRYIGESAYYRQLIAKDTIAQAEKRLEGFNAGRMRQAYLRTCLDHVKQHRRSMQRLRARFPVVPAAPR